MNRAEPSTGLDEEIDAVEAFTACHTSSKHGLTGLAREAVVSLNICFSVSCLEELLSIKSSYAFVLRTLQVSAIIHDLYQNLVLLCKFCKIVSANCTVLTCITGTRLLCCILCRTFFISFSSIKLLFLFSVQLMRAELMFQSDMEALRAEPVPEGEAAASSVQVLTKVLSNSSSQNFLKNVGIKPVATKKSSSVVENELREQLAAAQQNSTAQQAELEALRKKSEEAEERLARTQQKMEEYKKSCDENNELMRRFFEMQKRGPSST